MTFAYFSVTFSQPSETPDEFIAVRQLNEQIEGLGSTNTENR